MIEKEQIELMEQRIQRFNEFVMSQDIEKMPVGLFCGKIGLAIYFYHQAKFTQSKTYKRFANKLLNSTIDQLHSKTLINLEDGLIGVCLGLNYLVENNFQTGNINSILSELDDKIYQKGWFEITNNNFASSENLNAIVEIAYYFCIRLRNKNLDKNNRFLFESIVVKAINQIQNADFFCDKMQEPLAFTINEYFIINYLYLLGIVDSLGFYTYKVNKIIDEIYPKLYSLYPYSQTNRLQLVTTMIFLNLSLKRIDIEMCIKRLKSELDYEQLIVNEFRDQSMLLANGLTGMYTYNCLLHKSNELPAEYIERRIVNSGLWEIVENDKNRLLSTIGLFTGLAGVILIYQHLQRQK